MKRCSKCEFIYEDDQNVCDMDGQVLVLDQALTILPSQTANLTRPAAKATSMRGIALPTAAGLLLAALFSVGFYVSSATANDPEAIQAVQHELSGEDAIRNSWLSSAQAGVSVPEPVTTNDVESPGTTASPVELKDAQHAHINEGSRLSISRSLPALPRVRPLPRLPQARPWNPQVSSARVGTKPMRTTLPSPKGEPATAPKKGSKVGSLLKKTGRMLSKPFKL